MVDPKTIPHGCRCGVCGEEFDDRLRKLELQIECLKKMLNDARGLAYQEAFINKNPLAGEMLRIFEGPPDAESEVESQAPKPMVVPSADESVGVADPTTGDPEPGQGASPATKSCPRCARCGRTLHPCRNKDHGHEWCSCI